MKRITSLLLAAAFVMASVAGAAAADIKTTGQFDFAFEWTDNTGFRDADKSKNSEDDFGARQRVRVQTVITASENVSGTLFFEIGETTWGDAETVGRGSGGALGTDGVNIETRRAYIDFAVPSTALQIRMGLQGLALPSAVAGNPVFDDDVAAIVASYAFNDMYSLTAFWARPYDLNNGDDTNQNLKDEFDMAGLVFDVKGDGFALTPYVVYGMIGKDAGVSFNDRDITGDDATAWWGGAAFELTMFDPIVFSADAIYGAVDTDTEAEEASGWFLTGKLAYKMDMFTPTMTAWYGTGDDDDYSDGSERLPIVSAAGFAPTSFGFDGGAGILSDSIVSDSGVGTWGIALAAEDIKFIEDVTHTVRVAYYQGTNDEKAGIYGGSFNGNLSEEDSAWEVNVDTKYQIYENLTAAVELGWIKLDLDDSVWTGGADDTDDAWKAGVNLTYSF
ncbi:outer membrane homotrimeric porin [Oleidesulfovibrio sp.]|uniref:outer membrane homotrimeric porin n=1 Tax=Oleidesulfovibrio sp. TaxID=2909707 RepID=UPI003A8AE733